MKAKDSNNEVQQLVAVLLQNVTSTVPKYFTHDEKELLAIFLENIGYPSIAEFLGDVEGFLATELDFPSINMETVHQIDLHALAIKFGDKFGLMTLRKVDLNLGAEFSQLGWKSARTIFVKVLLPELKKLTFREAQNLVLILEEFVWSFALIQGQTPDDVFQELKFWSVFRHYQITFEIEPVKKSLLPKDEYIRWVSRRYSVEQAGFDLATKFGLIADQKQWVAFFKDHTTQVTVVTGKMRLLIGVLYQMEINDFVDKNKNKGCWKIWQLILVDESGQVFSQELRKISSKIFSAKTPSNEHTLTEAKEIIQYMKSQESDNSLTTGDNSKN